MILEHKTESFKLFYSEGTPHIWDMEEVGDENTMRFYSDDLKYGADMIYNPSTNLNDLKVYKICKNAIHRTRGLFEGKTDEEVVDILKTLPVFRFDQAMEEFTRKGA